MKVRCNWFPTLREALDSEGLSDLWPWDSSIAYGQNVRHIVEYEGVSRLISVYRETDGRYERPVHYVTNTDKKERDVYRDAARWRAGVALKLIHPITQERADCYIKEVPDGV